MRVIKSLSGTEFSSGLFSPWLCELRQTSIDSFCDLVNRLVNKLEVAPEVYSFFPDSLLADQLIDSKRRQDALEPLVRVSAYFVFSNNRPRIPD